VTDLHEAFSDPGHEAADSMARFLEQPDRLPGIRAIQLAMRRALDSRPAASSSNDSTPSHATRNP
jgi:hypothetical protein